MCLLRFHFSSPPPSVLYDQSLNIFYLLRSPPPRYEGLLRSEMEHYMAILNLFSSIFANTARENYSHLTKGLYNDYVEGGGV